MSRQGIGNDLIFSLFPWLRPAIWGMGGGRNSPIMREAMISGIDTNPAPGQLMPDGQPYAVEPSLIRDSPLRQAPDQFGDRSSFVPRAQDNESIDNPGGFSVFGTGGGPTQLGQRRTGGGSTSIFGTGGGFVPNTETSDVPLLTRQPGDALYDPLTAAGGGSSSIGAGVRGFGGGVRGFGGGSNADLFSEIDTILNSPRRVSVKRRRLL